MLAAARLCNGGSFAILEMFSVIALVAILLVFPYEMKGVEEEEILSIKIQNRAYLIFRVYIVVMLRNRFRSTLFNGERGGEFKLPKTTSPKPTKESLKRKFRIDRKCKFKPKRPKTDSTVSAVELEREGQRKGDGICL